MSVSLIDEVPELPPTADDRRAEGGGAQAKMRAAVAELIEAMQNGVLPWRQPWAERDDAVALHPVPRNALTGRPYGGFNAFFLDFMMAKKGWQDPRFLTVKQANRVGGRINKGEKGVGVFFTDRLPAWRSFHYAFEHDGVPVRIVDIVDNGAGSEALTIPVHARRTTPERVRLHEIDVFRRNKSGAPTKVTWDEVLAAPPFYVMKAATVFNLAQCSGLERFLERNPLPTPKSLDESSVNRLVGKIVRGMKETGMQFQTGYDSACYRLTEDRVCMPRREAFLEKNMFESVLLHEIGHGTGHPSRLNREFGAFGSAAYAKEELVAEMISYMIGRHTGLNTPIPGHAAYVQHWVELLRKEGESKVLLWAVRKADEAVRYIENVSDLKFADVLEHNRTVPANVEGLVEARRAGDPMDDEPEDVTDPSVGHDDSGFAEERKQEDRYPVKPS